MITNLNKRKLFHIYCGRFFLKKTRMILEYFINFPYSLSHIYTFIRELVKCTFGLVSRCVLLWIFLWLLLKVSVNSFSLFIVLFCNVNETSLLDKKTHFFIWNCPINFSNMQEELNFKATFECIASSLVIEQQIISYGNEITNDRISIFITRHRAKRQRYQYQRSCF